MDKKKSIIKKLKMFKAALNEEIPIEKMVFFGSRVGRKYSRWSDIDLVIVSKKFRNKKFRYRPLGFYKYWDLDYPVDFLCYTPEEFNRFKNQITIVNEAIKKGIKI